jgi:hypothetical protein
MQALKAHVRSGRIVVDDPTDLPEGTEVRLVLPDDGDDLDDDDREALHRALARGSADIAAGRTVDALEFLNALDARR